jgi:hypothetical protein
MPTWLGGVAPTEREKARESLEPFQVTAAGAKQRDAHGGGTAHYPVIGKVQAEHHR